MNPSAREKRILESIGDAVIVTDVESRITLINSVGEQLTGWVQREALGRPLDEVFHIVSETSRTGIENPIEKVKRLGHVIGLTNHTILIRRDGHEIHIDDSGAPILEEDGTLTGFVLIFRDIGDRRSMERQRLSLFQEVRARYAELEATYNNSAVAMAMIDPREFRYLRVNQKLCEILGQSRDAILGSKVSDIAGNVPGLQEALQTVAKGEAVVGGTIEGELSTSPGVKRCWTMDYTPVFGADGSVTAIAAASAEITQQRETEAALRETARLAAAGRLAAQIVREMTEPLSLISASLQRVRSQPLSPEVEQSLNEAQQALERVSRFTGKTLAMQQQATEGTLETA